MQTVVCARIKCNSVSPHRNISAQHNGNKCKGHWNGERDLPVEFTRTFDVRETKVNAVRNRSTLYVVSFPFRKQQSQYSQATGHNEFAQRIRHQNRREECEDYKLIDFLDTKISVHLIPAAQCKVSVWRT
jgi:hypothetical protein